MSTIKTLAPSSQSKLKPLRAALLGEHTIAVEGFTTSAAAPVLELCKLLLANGTDSKTPLKIFRDGILALKVRSIGEAAGLAGQWQG
jgi:hypothetical protein